ncbi:TRAP transporter small permease subunit [Mameliella alba]|uniref:TRAP transporter small permease subunit n=1 Tax=Mameliella alba TaxID=561184 RepID=UPI000B534A99|nr:TRAP transporter small permease subunit [Mameliella alba]OWV37141.1 C4-dicarboxylate ABC transporter substrate-binding protein [Mameliella alba]
MQRFSKASAIVFGLMMTVLCVVIAVETVLRKFLGHSLAGVDELSGYAIAIGAPLCFTVAVIEQAHIRINLLHMKMPSFLQAATNLLAALTLAGLALFLLVFTARTVQKTQLFQSVAQTPWATPLIWPQALWLVGMSVFALGAVLLALRATRLALAGRGGALRRDFGPDTVEHELEAELSDLKARA